MMTTPHFIKFTAGTRSGHMWSSPYEYRDGLNTESEWTPLNGHGGFSFTTLEHMARWTEGCTHVWDVTIPDDEWRVSIVAEGKCKAASIIMRNMRPIADLLTPYTPDVRAAIWRELGHVLLRMGVPLTDDVVDAMAPQLVSDRDGAMQYNNGLTVTHEDDMFTGTFTRMYRHLGITILSGTTFTCREFRNGYAYGLGTWVFPGGGQAKGVFRHTLFDGPGVQLDTPGIYQMGVFTPCL